MTAENKPQFVVDAEGKRTAVLMSVVSYERLQKSARKLRELQRIKADLRVAFKELYAAKQGKIKARKAEEFIDSL